MFDNLFGKKSKVDDEVTINAHIAEKIAHMNLTDMRAYLNNRITGFDVCEFGLSEVMKKLTTEDEESEQRYLKIDDMDTKIKKAFDIVLMIAVHKKISVKTVEYMQEFLEVYRDIIESFDTRNKQIYGSKLADGLKMAIKGVNAREELKNKMQVLG
ncbi:MAG: hypothetical protein FP820_06500 [Sulfurimonas sp.]|jgi:hypothetical protein|nr:hypothetical protein [Sulfurimonas sp.]MBU3938503.1 hypothetical protein [bacterium]MBU4024899.1 hypothetical protein [bacterium]MBU4059248.1 hypothetical protein [bacterium]